MNDGSAPRAKILVLSDLHLLAPGRTIFGIDPAQRMRAALDHAQTHHPDLALVLLLGDLTDTGLPEEYAHLRAQLDGCPVSLAFAMGNHDRRAAFRAAFPQAADDGAGFVQSVHDIGAWRLIALDTLIGPPHDDDQHGGILCPARLRWLAEKLAEAPERPTLIAAHHPLAPTGFPAADAIALHNAPELADLLSRHAQVRHMVFGHVHRTISGSYRGLSYSVFKSTAHQMSMELVRDDIYASTTEPGAYGLVLLGDEVIVHTEDFEIAQAPSDPSLAYRN